jgi:hypothetical protein
MQKNVIKRPTLFSSIEWDGVCISEIKDFARGIDFTFRSDFRLELNSGDYLDFIDKRDEHTFKCIMNLTDVIVKDLETGDIYIFSKEQFMRKFIDVQNEKEKIPSEEV